MAGNFIWTVDGVLVRRCTTKDWRSRETRGTRQEELKRLCLYPSWLNTGGGGSFFTFLALAVLDVAAENLDFVLSYHREPSVVEAGENGG